jgi:hypothetical protein
LECALAAFLPVSMAQACFLELFAVRERVFHFD